MTSPSQDAAPPERPETLPDDPRPIVLEARGITRHYELADKRLEVLRGIDIVVREGEMVSVMGMSGVGKSTLLNILGLLDTASSGQVIYHLEKGPVEGSGLKEDERAALRNEQIGFVFQFYHLLPDVNVIDNVLLPSMIRRSGARFRREKKELSERAASLLERVGLSGREKQMPGTLSGGERQRVAIARALMNQPRLLLCDEPTGNLDARTSDTMHKLFTELNETYRTTFLFVTHDPSLAARAEVQKVMIDGKFEEIALSDALAAEAAKRESEED